MRIEGKLRKQQRSRDIYEIAFNKAYRDLIPSRPHVGYPMVMVAGEKQYQVRVFKSEKSKVVWLSSHVEQNGRRMKLYDALMPFGFIVGDSIPFEYEDDTLTVLTATDDTHIPQELEVGNAYIEGAKKIIEVNAYERDSHARQECIALFGTACVICNVNLQVTYGLSKPIIEVHHLVPLSSIETGYQVVPKRDLRPVCPNCHTVLHLCKPPYTIEQVKSMLQKNSDA